MYTIGSSIVSDKVDLSNYIQDFDVYNSKLILLLSDPSIEREDYIIKTFEYRPDLIAKEVYGSTRFLGLLLLTQSIGIESYRKGTVLSIIPKSTLVNLINNGL